MKKNLLFAFMLFTASQLLLADDHEHHQQKAHVHGAAHLTLVLEGQNLDIQIESPADSLVGFEHTAETEQEKEKAEAIEAFLKTPGMLFTFNGSDCELQDTDINMLGILSRRHHAQEQHHNETEEDHEEHADIKAHYQFTCSEPATLESLNTHLFNAFPALKTVNVMWVTETEQNGMTLTKDNHMINLR